MRHIVLCLLIVLGCANASAADTVREFRGSGNTTTAIFTVESPWLLDWRLDADFDSMVALDVTLVEARTGKHVGRVLYMKRKGNGLKLFEEGGQYQLRISSTLARWSFKVQQIKPEEARLYTPRSQD